MNEPLNQYTCERGGTHDVSSSLNALVIELEKRPRALTHTEAGLVSSLIACEKDSDSLLRLLSLVSSLAAFNHNQDLFRESGVIPVLQRLLMVFNAQPVAVKVMLLQCVGNLTVNQNNQAAVQELCLDYLLKIFCERSYQPKLVSKTLLTTLLNCTLAVSPAAVQKWIFMVPLLLSEVKMSSSHLPYLQLTVNLSCHGDIAQALLCGEAPSSFNALIDPTSEDELLLRSLQLLLNLLSVIDTLGITSYAQLKTATVDCCSATEDKSFYISLRSLDLETLKLFKRHCNPEIAGKAKRLVLLVDLLSGT